VEEGEWHRGREKERVQFNTEGRTSGGARGVAGLVSTTVYCLLFLVCSLNSNLVYIYTNLCNPVETFL
jgi:hypothetical protein